MKNFEEFISENSNWDREPLLSGGINKFWLVTKATEHTELIDIITEVDVRALYNIARGSAREDDDQVELFTQDQKEEAFELANKRLSEFSTNESVVTGDDIQRGDLVDFGPYGKLYVCNPNYSDLYFWVTEDEEDRINSKAQGWTIDKSLAKNIIEEYND